MSDIDTEVLRRFYEKKRAHHEAKAASDEATAEYRIAEEALLDAMDDAGLKSGTYDLPGIGKVRFTRRKPTIYGRINDLEQAMEAFENSGRVDELFHPKVEGARLNEYVRECMDQGIPLPPGVDYYAKEGVTVSVLD